MKDENRDNKLRPLTEALEDHSAEGIALLSAEPRKLTMLAVVTTGVLVLCALLWSFFGHADVIVTAQGTLAPESEVRRFYAPVDGELVDLYVAEGQPVSKDDVVARLNARGAIEAAANALQAQLKLEDAEREWKQFPERKALLERRALALKQQIELNSRQHENRLA
ncbi:MAG: biotin/lipoyl-binding protein, partial [Cupriavidus sp.]|nr:biotin/lipoyl-binding protein [Cupriavidus sp.]